MSSFRFRVEHTNQRGVRILLLCLKVTGSQSRKGKNGDPSLITVGSMITIWWGVCAWVWRRWYSKRKWGLKMYRTHYSKCFTCLNIFNLCSSSESLAIIMNFSNHRLPLSSYFTRFLLLPIPIMIIKDELSFRMIYFHPTMWTTWCDVSKPTLYPALGNSATAVQTSLDHLEQTCSSVITTRGLNKPVAS